jgi:hypothetical protein
MEWFIPEDLRSRIPTLLPYEETSAIYIFFPDSKIERRNTAIVKVEGHRS